MKTLPFYITILFTFLIYSALSAQFDGLSIFDVKTGQITQAVNLGFGPAYNASFSNNGDKVAFDTYGVYEGIIIADLNNETIYPLEGGVFGNDASWSPNGSYIVFDRFFYEILVVPSEGGTPEFVAYGLDPEWNNSSEKIVFNEFGFGLSTINIDGTGYSHITSFGSNPSWSPNGNHIAFTDGNNIWMVDVDDYGMATGDPYQVTFDVGEVYNQQPTWSNNSKTLVFHSNRTTSNFDFDLWSVDISTGDITWLTGFPGAGDYDPCFSKNGKSVIFSTSGVSSAPVSLRNSSANLYQNYPNPFSSLTTIKLNVEARGSVQMLIYDQLGRVVSVMNLPDLEVGTHEVIWNPSATGIALNDGIYTLQLVTKDGTKTIQMVYQSK